jgi:aerobic carbon-monoxide dehydrogenase large subunit
MLVGRPVRRREDARILRGRTRYVDDISPPGALHIAFVRSLHARARIVAVNAPGATPIAAAGRGVGPAFVLITAADLAGRARPLPVQGVPGAQVADAPHPLLADGEVRYVGQPVAAVVAPSRAEAEDAAERVEVDYEPLDPITSPRDAHEELMRWHGSGGDVDAAFAAAAHVVRTRHAIPRLAAAPIEPRGVVALDEAGVLRIWLSAQETHRPLAQLAHALDRPPDSIHMIVPDVGGAFGSKGAIAPEAVVAAVAAIDLGRAVKWIEQRQENFLAAYQGRGVEGDVELALAADGRMLAVRARIVADLGAYLQPTTAVPPHTTGMLMAGCYDIAAADVEVVGARTNKVPTGPCRGAGRPEAAFMLERTVDAAARELGLDPVELRRRNVITEFPHRTPLGWTYDSGDYARCLATAIELVGEPPPGRRVGRGVALYVERAGGQWESADMTIEADGRVIVRSGSFPHGQGHDTTFAQIVADRLGVPMEDVVLVFGDSAEVPGGVGTFAGRSVAMGGSAVAVAADRLRAGERSVSVRFESDMVFGSGAYAALVEIDEDTGELTVHRIAAVDDAGSIINPLLAEGQVLGGTVQGLGAVLTEEIAHDEQGQPLSASFASYALLSAAEQPPIVTAFVESPSPLNPLGAKGIGEAGSIGTPAAIANAVTDALGGIQVEPPFTPEKLWRALQTSE